MSPIKLWLQIFLIKLCQFILLGNSMLFNTCIARAPLHEHARAHLLAIMKCYINIKMKTSSGVTNSDLTTCALGAIQVCN